MIHKLSKFQIQFSRFNTTEQKPTMARSKASSTSSSSSDKTKKKKETEAIVSQLKESFSSPNPISEFAVYELIHFVLNAYGRDAISEIFDEMDRLTEAQQESNIDVNAEPDEDIDESLKFNADIIYEVPSQQDENKTVFDILCEDLYDYIRDTPGAIHAENLGKVSTYISGIEDVPWKERIYNKLTPANCAQLTSAMAKAINTRMLVEIARKEGGAYKTPPTFSCAHADCDKIDQEKMFCSTHAPKKGSTIALVDRHREVHDPHFAPKKKMTHMRTSRRKNNKTARKPSNSTRGARTTRSSESRSSNADKTAATATDTEYSNDAINAYGQLFISGEKVRKFAAVYTVYSDEFKAIIDEDLLEDEDVKIGDRIMVGAMNDDEFVYPDKIRASIRSSLSREYTVSHLKED